MPVAANQTDNFPTYTITVNDVCNILFKKLVHRLIVPSQTQPIWVYCRQKTPVSHCGAGMVFAVNCGLDGAPNSFTNFKQSALAFGAAQATPSASADAGASAYPSVPAASGDAAGWTTAAYGGYTIPAAPQATQVTQTVTFDSQVWTTTYESMPGSPDPTPAAAEAAIHTVIVGGPGQLAFNPPSIQAKPRDVVIFEL